MAQSLIYESRIQVPYTWSAGVTGTRFFKSLRDEMKFMATRCPSCKKAYLPPLKTCGACFTACEEWLEVGPRGTLISFTQALYRSPAHPASNPIYGMIKLEGADTSLLHFIAEAPLEALKVGMKVEAVFADKRKGDMSDVLYFKPAR